MTHHFSLHSLLAGLMIAGACHAQSPLDKTVTVDFRRQRLDHVLQTLSNKGNFYFSYNSTLLRQDSLVTLNARDKTIRQILDLLFQGNLEYKIDGNYIILRRAPPGAGDLQPPRDKGTNAEREEKKFTITGIILDEETGERIYQASVYDKQRLTATLTDRNGQFRIRIKDQQVHLTISKELYEDTTIQLSAGDRQGVSIFISSATVSRRQVTISPNNNTGEDSIRIGPPYGSTIPDLEQVPIRVELTSVGRLLLSSRLTVQSINLSRFFTGRTFQVSLLPGLSTNGFMNSQITNKFSLNVWGGYAAGLNGLELGGIFNIDRKDVTGVQAAGIVNIVGGQVRGLQLAGIDNTILDTLKGVQLAGIMNGARKTVSGVQGAGILNYAHHLSAGAVQIGLINVSDSSEGYSIGLFNFVRHGYRQFSIFADEISPVNVAFRSGNSKLYTILIAGFNPDPANRFYRVGFGLGHTITLTKGLSLHPELTTERISSRDTSSFANMQYDLRVHFPSSLMLEKLHLDLHWRLNKWITLSAGPSLAIYVASTNTQPAASPRIPPHAVYPNFRFSNTTSGWIGWQAAIHFL